MPTVNIPEAPEVRTPRYNSCIKSVVMVFVIEPALAYVKAFCQRADRLEVRGAVLNSYDSVAICKVKDVLWAECCAKLDELKLEKIRHRDTSNHIQAKADLDDILDAMEKLDG